MPREHNEWGEPTCDFCRLPIEDPYHRARRLALIPPTLVYPPPGPIGPKYEVVIVHDTCVAQARLKFNG